MAKLKLTKGRSYTGIVKASAASPIVDVNDDEAKALVATGYFEPCFVPDAEAEAEAEADDSEETAVDYEALSDMTKAELAAYAEENGIDIDGCKTKADILEAISVANGGSLTMIDLQQ